MTGIYAIIHCATGRMYIGSSIDIGRRLLSHIYNLRRGKHDCSRLQKAWNKDGEMAFAPLVVEETADFIVREQFYLDNMPNLFNVNRHADRPPSRRGTTMSAEARRKIAAALRGRKRPQRSAEWSARISAANRGRKPSAETRRKLSAARIGNTNARRKFTGTARFEWDEP